MANRKKPRTRTPSLTKVTLDEVLLLKQRFEQQHAEVAAYTKQISAKVDEIVRGEKQRAEVAAHISEKVDALWRGEKAPQKMVVYTTRRYAPRQFKMPASNFRNYPGTTILGYVWE